MSVEAREELKRQEQALAEAAEGSLEQAKAQVALGITWGQLGQARRSVGLFERAWTTRQKELGPQSDEAITTGLNLATALRLDKRPREAFEVAERLLKVTPSSHAERVHVVAVYNQVKPPGFRPAAARSATKKARKSRR